MNYLLCSSFSLWLLLPWTKCVFWSSKKVRSLLYLSFSLVFLWDERLRLELLDIFFGSYWKKEVMMCLWIRRLRMMGGGCCWSLCLRCCGCSCWNSLVFCFNKKRTCCCRWAVHPAAPRLPIPSVCVKMRTPNVPFSSSSPQRMSACPNADRLDDVCTYRLTWSGHTSRDSNKQEPTWLIIIDLLAK